MQNTHSKLFRRDFSLVVIGQIISLFGSAILRFALDLYVLDIPGRADIFALVLALSTVPGILFTPIGGAIADRVNRRNLMVIFDFSASAIVLLLLFLLSTGNAPVGVIGVVLAVLSLISAMYQPAVQASVPTLVSEKNLASANGIVNGVMALSGLLGPVLGGILYGTFGLNALVAISSVALFLSAVMEIFIHIPFEKLPRTAPIVPTIMADMKTGMRYVMKENPLILKIILIATALNLFISPFFIVGMPYILRVSMQSSETLYGAGMGFAQLCMIIGALLAGSLTQKTTINTLKWYVYGTGFLLLGAALAVSPLVLGFGYWPPYILFLLMGGGVMMLATLMSVFAITLVQKETPNQLLGKVMAIVMALAQCAAPVGQALYGVLFENFNTSVYIPTLTAALCAMGIALVASRALAGHSVSTALTGAESA